MTGTIHAGQCFDANDFLNLRLVKYDLQPTAAVTYANPDPKLLGVLAAPAAGAGDPCEVRQLKKHEFGYEAAKRRLLGLLAPHEPGRGPGGGNEFFFAYGPRAP